MFYRLSGALKDRFIEDLRRYWKYHPKYPDLPNNIQGKYSFEERPNWGIIVKVSGGSRVDMSADNYRGITHSYVYLAKVPNYNGLAIEWVREDIRAIQQSGQMFPSPPGVYYIELTEDNEFYVDPLLDERNEQVTKVTDTEWQLQRGFLAGTLRLYEMPNGFMFQEGVNYTADPNTGTITLTQPMGRGRSLVADYRYPGETTGPHPIYENYANNTAIPGCVLAFGRRNKKGDRMAVVVQEVRQAAAQEYGGRWEISLDFEVLARDVDHQQEIIDQTVIYLWGILRSQLSSEGIEVNDVSLGGETEEVYDETGDDYYYNATFSLTAETEWTVFVPLVATLRHIAPLTESEMREVAGLPDDLLKDVVGNIRLLESLGLEAVTDPFFSGKTQTYESIY